MHGEFCVTVPRDCGNLTSIAWGSDALIESLREQLYPRVLPGARERVLLWHPKN